MKHNPQLCIAEAHELATWNAWTRHVLKCKQCTTMRRLGEAPTHDCETGLASWDEWRIASRRLLLAKVDSITRSTPVVPWGPEHS